MIRKKTKKLPSEFKQALAKLAGSSEFNTFKKLCNIEENNIVIESFKVNSSDPDLKRKKAHLEGRRYELRKMLRTFEDALKEIEKED